MLERDIVVEVPENATVEEFLELARTKTRPNLRLDDLCSGPFHVSAEDMQKNVRVKLVCFCLLLVTEIRRPAWCP